jgi:Zn finger protein HypA/HybF involved in hydrogenase expression
MVKFMSNMKKKYFEIPCNLHNRLVTANVYVRFHENIMEEEVIERARKILESGFSFNIEDSQVKIICADCSEEMTSYVALNCCGSCYHKRIFGDKE